MSERERIEAVRRAIHEVGPRPEWHRQTMERHRREWPTLWAALDDLLAFPGVSLDENARR